MQAVGVWLLAAVAFAASADVLDRIHRRGVLRVGFAAGYMPFEMIDRTSGSHQRFLIPTDPRRGGQEAHFIGFDLDIAREMAKELGVRMDPVNTRFPQLLLTLDTRRIDMIISGMSITPERSKRVDFSDPYMTVGQTVLVNVRHRDKVKSYRDLNSPEFMVASPPGTTGAAAVRQLLPNATFTAVESEWEAIKAVREGHADAFVYDLPHNAIAYAMDDSQQLIFLDQPFTTEQLAIAIRKDNPKLLEWINGFLAKLKQDGRYQKIHDKWFQSTSWHSRVR